MRRFRTAWIAMSLGIVAIAGCTGSAEVPRDELAEVVARDGVGFPDRTIPPEVLDWAAAHRVVVLGETHHLREHWDFTAALLGELHARGFRQLLVEQPQMADWWLDDYVGDDQLLPEAQPPPNWVRKFQAIRELNATLPASERIHVRAIDVNEEHYGGASSFRSLLDAFVGHLPEPGPVARFLRADYETEAAQRAAIEALQTSLGADRSTLTASWGVDSYETVVEMVEVERASIEIRAARREDDDRAAREREDVIKQLADARIDGYPHGTVINIGGNHAQKSHLKGTEQEWLGDYLVNRSTAVDGPTAVLSVVSARTELLEGAGGTPFDVVESSPEHELFRLMAEQSPGETVFLSLDDAMFATRTIAVNYEGTIYEALLSEHYDAVLQYGLAHRMPAD